MTTQTLALGQPAPWFTAQALDGNSRYVFHTAAGRWTLMLFVRSAGTAETQAALAMLQQHRGLFDDDQAIFFGVTCDPEDEAQGRIRRQLPGIRWFLDYDREVSHLYGLTDAKAQGGDWGEFMILDRMQRLVARAPISQAAALLARFAEIAKRPVELPAPVLVLPAVLSAEMCRRLVALYEEKGGSDSGFMRQVDGKTKLIVDHGHKQRFDCMIEDERLIATLNAQISHAVRPMLQRAFQFDPTHVERWIVARYDATDGGHFRPHRDNTTAGTAHRRFAVTINLNAGDYEGGDLCFPEFGNRTYRAPTGGAVVFSCSLLHEVKPVTKGTRYAFLPFLYDEAGAELRQRNAQYLDLSPAAQAAQ